MTGIRGAIHARKALLLLIVAGLTWGGIPLGRADSASAPMRLLDKPAPAFSLSLFTGENVRIADFQGQVLVLNFWAAG